MELISFHGAPGVVVPLDSPYMEAAARAIEQASAAAPSSFAKGARSRSCDLSRKVGSRYATAGLGAKRRQHAQPEREILPGGLSPRHQGQRPLVGRNSQASGNNRRRSRRIRESRTLQPVIRSEFRSSFTTPHSTLFRMLDRKFVVENVDLVRKNCATAAQRPTSIASSLSKPSSARSRPKSIKSIARRTKSRNRSARPRIAAEREARKNQGRELREQTTAAQAQLDALGTESDAILRTIPNLSHPDAPTGADDQSNLELRKGKTPLPKFDFKPFDHVDAGRAAGTVRFRRGSQGRRPWLLFLAKRRRAVGIGAAALCPRAADAEKALRRRLRPTWRETKSCKAPATSPAGLRRKFIASPIAI